jgi:Na+-translocating ferredoxin:NAD+ oxidoreductase RnfD subunit
MHSQPARFHLRNKNVQSVAPIVAVATYFVGACPLQYTVLAIAATIRAWSVVTNITITNLVKDDVGHDLTLS